MATGIVPNRRNRRDAELQLELEGAFSLLLSACMRLRRLMAQARYRGIEPKLSPEMEALIRASDGLESVRINNGERTHLDSNYEQVVAK